VLSLRNQIIQTIMRDTKETLLTHVPIEERRQRINEAAKRGIRLPRGVTARALTAGGVPAECIEPEDAVEGRVILYLHGGGYVLCSLDTHRGLAGRIARSSQARLLNVDYRLAPEHPFPAGLEDAVSAYKYLLKKGFEPNKIAIGGDSAGGGLTIATALTLRERSIPLPGALFLISPWTDLTFSGKSVRTRAKRDPVLSYNDDWMLSAYSGKHPLTDPLISPVFANLDGLPPILIQVGTEEILYDDSTRLRENALKAGVYAKLEVWPQMWHVFQASAPYIPEAQQAIDKIGKFIGKHL
jgi:monoterpene epsilon-lactone hydrolase